LPARGVWWWRCSLSMTTIPATLALFTALITGAGSLRLPPRKPGMRQLPPAGTRDIVEEARVAAAAFRPSSVPLFQPVHDAAPPQPRRLVLLTLESDAYRQLVSEVVTEVTSGARAGTTWCKPLALRETSNVTLAQAAHRFDPTLGWCSADGAGSVPSNVHVFTPLAPAAFLPTAQLEDAPPILAAVVRSMSDACEADTQDLLVSGAPVTSMDAAKLHEFARALEAASPAARSDGLYDPLA